MKTCKVVAYLVEVRKLHAKSADNLKFGNFNGAETLRAALQKILGGYAKYSNLKLYEKTFKVDLHPANNGPLTGLFMSGDYGQAGDIVDTTSGSVAYKKKRTEALPEPFFFYMAVPDHEQRGVLCLQQAGLVGVKGLFETTVAGVFSQKYPEYRLHIRQMTVADMLSEYLKSGAVEEIIVEKHEIPSDIADRFGGVKKAYPGKFTYTIQAKAGLFKKDGLIAFAKGQKELSDVFEFDDHGFDVVKTKIRIGNETKTLNLTRPDSISSSFDITGDVALGADGYPTVDSLKKEFEKIASDLAKRGGIKL
ncbi:hypothetical protein [Ensifer sp. ZNC0028]|uniref:hypothetical protein n=1 Tax=Ensifer sp. ZNC0028 TaxID=1339236 RepID=UPI0012E02A6B|nr:hypothetical protein [Ensifer sp. ZNC0028]